MSQTARRWFILLAEIAIVVLTDRLAKRFIVDALAVGESRQPIPALMPFFQLTHSQNTGAAFGFLPQAGDLFLLIALLVMLAMLFFFPRIPQYAHLTRLAVGLICGGALGNALDRLEYGHVVDFIHYQIPGFISNVSNLADHAIVLGVFLIFIDSWRTERIQKRQQMFMEAQTPDE